MLASIAATVTWVAAYARMKVFQIYPYLERRQSNDPSTGVAIAQSLYYRRDVAVEVLRSDILHFLDLLPELELPVATLYSEC